LSVCVKGLAARGRISQHDQSTSHQAVWPCARRLFCCAITRCGLTHRISFCPACTLKADWAHLSAGPDCRCLERTSPRTDEWEGKRHERQRPELSSDLSVLAGGSAGLLGARGAKRGLDETVRARVRSRRRRLWPLVSRRRLQHGLQLSRPACGTRAQRPGGADL
jgi:hypothetical protein